MSSSKGEGSLHNTLSLIDGGAVKARVNALDDLVFLFDKRGKTADLSKLTDKTYHHIFEVLFRCAITEKKAYYGGKKTTAAAASTRLAKCAEALRLALNHGISKLKRKTVLAVIDHVTQTLPAPTTGATSDGTLVEPLRQDYLKSIITLLSHQATVEQLATTSAEGWSNCVDFCINSLGHFLEIVTERDSASRASPAPGTGQTFSLAYSTARSSNPSQKGSSSQVPRAILQDLVHCIHLLVLPPNAPLDTRSRKLATVLLKVLTLRQGLGPTTYYAFAAVNVLLASVQADDIDLAREFSRDLVPLVCGWWQGRTVSKDEMLNSVRDEMTKTLFIIPLHLEKLLLMGDNSSVLSDLEDLAEALWLEYTRRSEQAQLQLDDLTFSALPPDRHFALRNFGLRKHHHEGERKWAFIQNLAILESLIWRTKQHYAYAQQAPTDLENGEQSRKRRRVAITSRIQEKLDSSSVTVQRVALQLLPFLLEWDTDAGMTEHRISSMIAETSGLTASWAMIAYASFISHERELPSTWKSAWQMAARAVTLPTSCRAACHLLHTILMTDTSYHSIVAEVNNIVTTADVNGPATLADSSVRLMLHLLSLRNAKVPSASQQTQHHILRWIFLRWDPADSSYAALYTSHVHPSDLVSLICTCCDVVVPLASSPAPGSGGALYQAWRSHCETQSAMRYVLLLPDLSQTSRVAYVGSQQQQESNASRVGDSASHHSSRRLTLELFTPKLGEERELCQAWSKRGSEGGVPISSERLRSMFAVCLVGAVLVPHLQDLNSRQSQDLEATVFQLLESTLETVLSADDNRLLVEILVESASPLIPALNMSTLGQTIRENRCLLRLFASLAGSLSERAAKELSGQVQDIMDLDDDPDSQESRISTTNKMFELPRRANALHLSYEAFQKSVVLRLFFLEAVNRDTEQVGLIPAAFMNHLMQLSQRDLLLSSDAVTEIFGSDFTVDPDDALRLVESLGEIIGEPEFVCCEAVHSISLDIIQGLMPIWLDDKHEVAACVGDLYHYFVKSSLPQNTLSPHSQIMLAQLLFALLRSDPQYGNKLQLSSCRTTLLYILQHGPMTVKHKLATRLPEIFDLYVLKTHDDVFVDILNSLPADAEHIEGIAFRLYVLSELACHWPTLLRRCIYHIFETPGKLPSSVDYATRCLAKVATALQLPSPKELFRIFSPQLLYTWLEEDDIEDMPSTIFGFENIKAMLDASHAEATALLIMRGQEDQAMELAQKLSLPITEMIKKGFAKVIAYAIAHDTSTSTSGSSSAESRVRKHLGKETYIESIYTHFADIVGCLFDLFDQEDMVESYWSKDRNFTYAAAIMAEIKEISHSDVGLPANQQPMFKAKHLLRELFQLCSRTEYELQNIWTPALVVAVSRKLFNSVHPALGSLHACSALRKVRVLVCLAGTVALDHYPLEMLLHSIRPFIVDSECADDAIGMSQYLVSRGTQHLAQNPSFLAGYALSTLASLRVFLESSQASTTQESQFRATMNKAQQFHSWLTKFLADYKSPRFADDQQHASFMLITESASQIHSSGNAESGTHESALLLEVLKDDDRANRLLNGPARDLALGMLCGEFVVPSSARTDVIGNDTTAVELGDAVWRSCKTHALSDEYLAWAGRVVGRSFAASGEIQPDLLQESQLKLLSKLASGTYGSEQGLFTLLQRLTLSKESLTAGLAESTLRAVVSEAALQGDDILLSAAQKTLAESLYTASEWQPYRTPPSENVYGLHTLHAQALYKDQIELSGWVQQVASYLVRAVSDHILLTDLLPVVLDAKGFAEEALPFIVHLALREQWDKQQSVKRQLSEAIKAWLAVTTESARSNQKQLISVLLYLRTQGIPNESSIADRINWLDLDYFSVASAATRCGMHKTALLFTELATSLPSRSSRRSSAAREADSNDVLLAIFENIDDPDAYYGLPQPSSLSNVLSRLEYEHDGSKSLAFRGAQFDSHLRRRDPTSQSDGLSLVKALTSLGLSGLAHSILQTQEHLVENADSLENTFHTARKLELWNLPAPSTSTSPSVLVYKTFQSSYQATDLAVVRTAVYEGFARTMQALTSRSLNAAGLRDHLGVLAALTELDDVVNVQDFSELQNMMHGFENRSKWMRRGRYHDISNLLSCRETTLSLLAQQPTLRGASGLSSAQAKEIEVRSMIMSSGIYRFHQATQESLRLSTSLTDLIAPCEDLGLNIDAAIHIESANSLWDHGEMIPSIRMLQAIDEPAELKNQTILVARSDVLSRIGHQVSVAKLEKPHDIQKKYLEPALKELKGKSEGAEAGRVFHQFAMFCDEQLQSPDGLEDLARLQNLRKGKSEEVAQLKALILNSRDSQGRTKYSGHLAKAQQWLHLDEQELRRVEQTRNEFVRLSLENYLLCLIASDEHNSDTLRFAALWLERSDDEKTNDAVRKHLDKVPTRKFASLMNQLSSRLQDQPTTFQILLNRLVLNICVDHPYHGMYHIWSGAKAKANIKDEVAVLRQKATEKVAKQLERHASIGTIWHAIDRTSGYYHRLAIDRDNSRYKAGLKINLKDTSAGAYLVNALNKYHIPPPTMQLELSADRDYSKVPIIAKLEPQMSIASGVSAPKIITAVGSDGRRYRQLVKGGSDDLRQDAIMEQVFAAVSSLLKLHRETQQRKLGIRTYKVLPLTMASGLIEFVPNTIPLHEYLMPAHERYHPKDFKGSQCRKEISNAQGKSVEARVSTYKKVKDKFHPVMKYFFLEYFVDPDEWFVKRTAYTRTTAAISMLGHVLGLGDRHGHNILLDTKTGEVVHIDLGVAFEMGRILPVPELVPFRMTRDIEDGMGITKTEGVFRRCCEFTLDALREETYSIMTILDVLRYDPLHSWSISPVRLAKLQDTRDNDGDVDGNDADETEANKKVRSRVNEPSEADRALEVVRKKLSKTLSVTATVNDLINQATDERNLAVLYSGWAAYA